jgi:hypothetical protein
MILARPPSARKRSPSLWQSVTVIVLKMKGWSLGAYFAIGNPKPSAVLPKLPTCCFGRNTYAYAYRSASLFWPSRHWS